MSERTEALKALEQVFPSTLATMDPEFDSHEFILALAHRHQQLYVQALAAFADSEYPFMVVHGEIARRLSTSGLALKNGERNSEDIFRQKNSATVWRKL